ncbi:MAG: hypothetical protein ACJ75S_07350 [Solirubrobacterales bacterium]
MSTPQQKAEDRPISFVLHNMAKGEDPIELTMVIRPEDLTRSDTSRMSVTQTLGGGFVDNFGPGIPTVQISGHTGWGSGSRPDGRQAFFELHDQIFSQWHQQRAQAVKDNLNPDRVKLIFNDVLDSFTWVVAPQNFVLRRSRSRPLLSQYQINLTWVSYDVAETLSALDALKAKQLGSGLKKLNALESLAASIKSITKSIADKITKVLGPIRAAVDKFTQLTTSVLHSVNNIVLGVLSVPAAIATQGLLLAQSLTKAASNIYHAVAASAAIPLITKAYFMRVASAFENAFCVLKNVLKPRLLLPNYDDLYGGSNCSSTSGGHALSPYDLLNPFYVYQPPKRGAVYVQDNDGVFRDNTGTPMSSAASSSLNALASMDPVTPLSLDVQAAHMDAVTAGLRLAA